MNKESREQIGKGLVDGSIRMLEPDDTFRFKCTSCGACCFDIDVLLNPMDVYMLARSKMARNTYKVRWTHDLQEKGVIETFRGHDSKFPLCMLSFRPSAPEGVKHCPFLVPAREDRAMADLLKGVKNKAGVFAGAARGARFVCSLHEEGLKPTICRLSPLGRTWKGDAETKKFIESKVFWQPIPGCPGIHKDKVNVVREYFQEAGLDKVLKYSDWWYKEFFNEHMADLQKMPDMYSFLVGSILYDLDAVVLAGKYGREDPALEEAKKAGKVPSQELGADDYFELMKENLKKFMDGWRPNSDFLIRSFERRKAEAAAGAKEREGDEDGKVLDHGDRPARSDVAS